MYECPERGSIANERMRCKDQLSFVTSQATYLDVMHVGCRRPQPGSLPTPFGSGSATIQTLAHKVMILETSLTGDRILVSL